MLKPGQNALVMYDSEWDDILESIDYTTEFNLKYEKIVSVLTEETVNGSKVISYKFKNRTYCVVNENVVFSDLEDFRTRYTEHFAKIANRSIESLELVEEE